MNENKKFVIWAMERCKGDDLERARASFRGLGPKQMAQEHGESGRSRFEILAELMLERERWEEAYEWLQNIED